MNVSAETFSPQLETLVSWLWKKMYDLRLSPCLILKERRWWLFFLASWREAYWLRNAQLPLRSYGESAVVRSRINLRLRLSGWKER